jgi:type VI secretion system protein ImpF
MAELTPQDRLQPSLLDRLTDEAPHNDKESRSQRVISLERLRDCVLRDLEWLLNTGNLRQLQDLSDFPAVEQSVLNYGVDDLSGVRVTSVKVLELERRIRQAIQTFEPRILSRSVRVRGVVDEGEMTQNALTFVIEGELWGEPVPLRLLLKTEVDLETGFCRVSPVSA